jgi:hypothetical protein
MRRCTPPVSISPCTSAIGTRLVRGSRMETVDGRPLPLWRNASSRREAVASSPVARTRFAQPRIYPAPVRIAQSTCVIETHSVSGSQMQPVDGRPRLNWGNALTGLLGLRRASLAAATGRSVQMRSSSAPASIAPSSSAISMQAVSGSLVEFVDGRPLLILRNALTGMMAITYRAFLPLDATV